MKKVNTKVSINYTYVAEHSGAHYTLNGVKFMNHGDFMECCCKGAYGLEPKKDGNTPFWKESDIPEYHASVKSSECSVFNSVLGDNFEDSLLVYLDRVVSTEFWYAQDFGEDLTIYQMDINEFEAFLRMFGRWEKDRKVIRTAKTSSKMLKWLDERVA